jgi:RNA polymerase sigma-70 factor (ECF subfamily)
LRFERVQEASENSFEAVAMPHLDAVYRAALALCGHDQAEDLTQTVFLNALKNFGSFAAGTNGKAWLLRILRNAWFDVLRHRKVIGTSVPVEEASLAAPEPAAQTSWSSPHDLLENFADEDVIRALGELPDDQRLTLYLVDVEELDHQEVATILDVPVGTVKSRASRARAALKAALEEKAKDLGFIGRVEREAS